MIVTRELYGMLVQSELPLGGLAPSLTTPGTEPLVRIRVGRAEGVESLPEMPIFVSETKGERQPALVAVRRGEWFELRYAEGALFHVSADGLRVWCSWQAPLTADDAASFLLGPVLGLVLRLRGVLAIHASAVVANGVAWGFVGEGGAGKSTLAAALAREGLPLLTEDVLALRPLAGVWHAYPAYDHVRIWEDSERILLGRESALRPLSPTWPKRAMPLAEHGLVRAERPIPMGGWFLLGERVGAAAAAGPGTLEPLARAEAVLDLSTNSYVAYLLDDRTRALELPALGALVERSPVAWLRVGNGAEGLARTVRQLKAVMSGVTW